MGNVKIIVALGAILINKFKFAGRISGSVRYKLNIGIINYKFMSPGQLTFYYINSVACFIIDIIAVKP